MSRRNTWVMSGCSAHYTICHLEAGRRRRFGGGCGMSEACKRKIERKKSRMGLWKVKQIFFKLLLKIEYHVSIIYLKPELYFPILFYAVYSYFDVGKIVSDRSWPCNIYSALVYFLLFLSFLFPCSLSLSSFTSLSLSPHAHARWENERVPVPPPPLQRIAFLKDVHSTGLALLRITTKNYLFQITHLSSDKGS